MPSLAPRLAYPNDFYVSTISVLNNFKVYTGISHIYDG